MRPFVRSYGVISISTLSPTMTLIRNLRILPAAEKDKKEFITEAGISPTKILSSVPQTILNYSNKKQKTVKGFDLLDKNV